MEQILVALAWFALIASIFKTALFPFLNDIPEFEFQVERREFATAWKRTCLESLIITLLALRVLGKI